MLAPHAVDIAVTISSLIASLCFTFAEPFNDIFLLIKSSCVLVSGNTNKSLRPKERSNLVPRVLSLPTSRKYYTYLYFLEVGRERTLGTRLGKKE